jgi:uncharacterized protein with HEPN domain
MNENRLSDYIDHIQQAATDVCSFVEGLAKDDFLIDKRTQQAVIMSLIIIGEAATKVMEGYAAFTQTHPEVPQIAGGSDVSPILRRHCIGRGPSGVRSYPGTDS